jgi:hypothetical protein
LGGRSELETGLRGRVRIVGEFVFGRRKLDLVLDFYLGYGDFVFDLVFDLDCGELESEPRDLDFDLVFDFDFDLVFDFDFDLVFDFDFDLNSGL